MDGTLVKLKILAYSDEEFSSLIDTYTLQINPESYKHGHSTTYKKSESSETAGQTLEFSELYELHSVGKPYVLVNYREALCRMEQEGKVTMDRPCPPRKKGTLAQGVRISFPRR